MITRRLLLVLALAFILGANGLAAPSLPVVRPMVAPALSYTGPTNDPHAGSGQWFRNLTTSELENRTHEFYDNTLATGGGSMGHLAVSGVVVRIEQAMSPTFPFGPMIVAFDVLATVHNNASSPTSGLWTNGVNRHGESLSSMNRYTNTLENIILTANFAIIDSFPFNAINEPAYTDLRPFISATNADFAAWFGKPGNYLDGLSGFFVPGWSLGTLLPNQSTNRLFSFVIHNINGGDDGIPSEDPTYDIIMNSSNNQSDIFINRSSSLKINTWVSIPANDDGSDYPMESTNFLGNVSVFHNIAGDPGVAIIGASFQPTPFALIMNSVGSSGVVKQILQSNTNLMTANWANIATNLSWPLPVTNSWTNVISGPEPVNFYRIIQ